MNGVILMYISFFFQVFVITMDIRHKIKSVKFDDNVRFFLLF